ncbi:MAG: efflux RND transporter periplasmic adaptor subunit [Myxococcaceae bacterium]
MKWVRIIIAAVLVLGVVGITVQGLRKREKPAVEVQLATAKRATITRTIAGAGKLQAATTVKISSNLSGDLTELLVREGDKVTTGQVLGRIDRQRFEAAARQASAGASAAKAEIQLAQVELSRVARELARVKGLVDKGMASAAELDKLSSDHDGADVRIAQARQRHAQSMAMYDEAQTSLSKTTLTSPIDGTVIQLSREVGERVRGSDFSEDVIMVIAALNAMEVKIEVGEQEVVHLSQGQKSEVTVDALEGQTFTGTVTEIAQQAKIKNEGTESEVTSFPVTVALSNRPPGALPGMSAEARIGAETRENAVVVPIQAVSVRPESALPDFKPQVEQAGAGPVRKGETLARVVFVVDAEGKARVRRVRTGISSDTEMEILEGIADGDRIIEGPYRTLSKELKDGEAVKESTPGGKGRG